MAPEYMELMKDSFIREIDFHRYTGNVDYYTGSGGHFKFRYSPQPTWDGNHLYLPFIYRGDPVILVRYSSEYYGL